MGSELPHLTHRTITQILSVWTLVVQGQLIALRVSHFSLSIAIKICAGKPLAINSYKPTLSVQMLRPTDFFLVFRVLLMIQFDLPGLRGSCAASTYSVEDGPNAVI